MRLFLKLRAIGRVFSYLLLIRLNLEKNPQKWCMSYFDSLKALRREHVREVEWQMGQTKT